MVGRIYENHADGASPRAIAPTLNAEGIPGLRGRELIDTTIRDQVDRGTGLLNNELYAGRLIWNRCSYIRDPSTGKRLSRLNSKEEWKAAANDGRQDYVRSRIVASGDGVACVVPGGAPGLVPAEGPVRR